MTCENITTVFFDFIASEKVVWFSLALRSSQIVLNTEITFGTWLLSEKLGAFVMSSCARLRSDICKLTTKRTVVISYCDSACI